MSGCPHWTTVDLPDRPPHRARDVPALLGRAGPTPPPSRTAAAAGDDGPSTLAIQQYLVLLEHTGALVTVAGAECGDPAHAANAAFNVPIPSVHQVATGFGSVWAGPATALRHVARVDPDSGEVLAAVDVGAHRPRRSPPTDG